MSDQRDGPTGQEDVPIDPAEGHFAEVVEAGFGEEAHRAEGGEGEGAGDRFLVVVEIEQERFAVAGFDEAVGVAVEAAAEGLAGDEVKDILGEDLGFEVRDRSGFGSRAIGGVADDEDVGVGFALQGVLVGRDVVEFVAEAGAVDHFRTHVWWDGDQQVVGDLFFVPGDDGFLFGVDAGDGEVVDHGNTFFVEQAGEDAGGDGFGEGAGHRGDVDDFRFLAQALFLQPGIGEEGELERGHGALDRHFTDVDDKAPALPGLQALGQCLGAFKGVELVHVFAPIAVDHAFDLFGCGMDAGGDDQDVVGDLGAVRQKDAVGRRVNAVDVGLAVIDPARDGAGHRPTDIVILVDAKGHEEITRLVVMVGGAIDEGDGPFAFGEFVPQGAGHDGAGRACAENEEGFHDLPLLCLAVPQARSQRLKMSGSLIA